MQANLSPAPQLPISDKVLQRTSDDVAALTAALQGAISGGSDVISAYESALAKTFDARHAIAVSSGGAALIAALYGAGVKPGDEVILPPTCPLCTIYPIMALGATPVFCDTNPGDFGLDLADLKKVATSKTRAVIDVPMWGYPTPVDKLRDATQQLGAKLILDLAHSHGAKLAGRDLSSYGDLSCYSTHERKIISTGEGGFILSNDDALTSTIRSYIKFGNLNGRDFGLNYKLSGTQAALGKARLAHLDELLARRRATAERVAKGITRQGVRPFDILPTGVPSYYFMLVRLSLDDNKRFIDYLDTKGIPSDIKRYGCKTLYQFPALEQYRRACPNAEALLNSVTTIPVHPGITDAEADYMIATINAY